MAQSQTTESSAAAAWHKHDYRTTATIVIEAYGAEIYSFLLAQFRGNAACADDVFSAFREDFWCGLPNFRWSCSICAWCYRLARNAASRYRRNPANRRDRRVSLSDAPFLDDLMDLARTTTCPHLRTDVKDEFQRLREHLTQEERDLLVLRVDRELSWRDVAHAMLDQDEVIDEDRVRKLEASLRQRFVEVKKRLRSLAEAAGLL
jgi:RNA polymerase sigma factor (sigma-70 family)